MGTKVQCKSSLPGFYPMRELNNDTNSHNWHLFYGERAFTNAQYPNVFLPRTSTNGYLGDDKDAVKQKMLEHEAIFKNQVFELHRLYRKQRDLMAKIKSTELCRNQLAVDSLLSSSPMTSQVTSEDGSRRNLPYFRVANSSNARFSISGVEEVHSSMISSQKPCFFSLQNDTRDLQVLESRPTKFRRKVLDLQLPADEYIDSEPDISSHHHNKDQMIDLGRDIKFYAADDGERTGCLRNARKSGTRFEKNTSCLSDLDNNNILQGLQTKRWPVSSQPVSSLYELNEAPLFHSTDKDSVEQSRDGSVFGLQFTKRCHEKIKGEPLSSSSFVPTHTSTPQLAAPDFSKLSYYNRAVLGCSSEFKEEMGHPSSVSCNFWKQGNGNDRTPTDSSPSVALKLLEDSSSVDVKCTKERGFKENCTLLPWLRGKTGHLLSDDIFNKEFESDMSCKSVSEGLQDPKKAVFDINLPCDPLVAELNEAKVLIDLNLSLSDDEERLIPTPKSNVRTWGEIDLEEAPASSDEIIETTPELDSKRRYEGVNEQDGVMELAAEAIVSIASSVCDSHLEDCMDNGFDLLVEMAVLYSNEYEEGMDSFESMTLGLAEAKAEEYMPKPLVLPGHITMEEDAAKVLQGRPRKGQARRGRQRRDFQRDILPGLTSLSRQEVTEDLNTFGGLMRAMGHEWNSGSTKRNSSRNAACGRGRRRSMTSSSSSPSTQPAENVPSNADAADEMMGVDNRRLTGWGKTTRRPRRRQRVPVGNLATIVL
ncbi:uncharacterized protein LOC111798571 [Cucurbita pepo subsp. pepo]|uniref:uncharacterized protein LOC111798571 n=1 Tax=Cucurbita pepo subsp. pepo TaxID=3664 RepID=UPI000C9D614B|nr:uncharacterized protein LOC111798571 [Cucurbita pepo subsp. pepo]